MFAVLGLAIGFAIVYSVTLHEIGPTAAGRVLRGPIAYTIVTLAMVVAVVSALYYVYGPDASEVLWILNGVVAGLTAWFCWFQLQPMGAKVADLGRSPRQILALIAAPLMFLGQWANISRVLDGSGGVATVIWLVVFGWWAGSIALVALRTRQIRDGGILDISGPIRWDQIQRYEWSEEAGPTVTLWTNRNRLLAWRVVSVRVPGAQLVTVARALREHVPFVPTESPAVR
jgi:hypothetical protein